MDYKKTVRAILSNRKLTVADQINRIKLNVNASEYKEALKFHPLFLPFLKKDAFFKTIEDIKIKEPFTFTGDFIKELKWLTINVEMFLPEINLFMKDKHEFESKIALADYPQATSILKQIEENFGVSLWSIEANMLLTNLKSGSEANWQLLTDYLTKIKNPYYEFNINSSSKRVESNISYDSFINQFQNDIDNIFASGFVKDYFVFNNLNFANYDFEQEELQGVIYLSNIFSIIDQYLSLIDVTIYHIATFSSVSKHFIPFITKAKDIVLNDKRLSNIFVSQESSNKIITTDSNKEILHCLNCYYKGDFSNSLILSKQLLKEYPLEYELYQTYCKSLINLEFEYSSPNISPTVDNILKDTFQLLSFSKDTEESFSRLSKTSLIFMNFNLGKQIFGLLSEVSGITNKAFVTAIITTTFISPKILLLTKNINNLDDFLFQNQSFKIYSYKYQKKAIEANLGSSSKTQEILVKAEYYFRKQAYEEVISILTGLEKNLPNYYEEKKNSFLIYSYIGLNQLSTALELFTNIYFDKKIIYRKINYEELYDKIEAQEDKFSYAKLIDCSILYSLVIKGYDLYEVYDEFLSSQGIYSVRDININEFITRFGISRLTHFLFKVATIDTLKYNTDYYSINDVEEDRLYLLDALLKIDPTNAPLYQAELDEIYRSSSIRKVLKEVDEGRLFIDINRLKELQEKKLNEDFKRFKEIESLTTNQSLIGFNPSNTKDWENALMEKTGKVVIFNSADYLAFKNIYLESRNNFLFSKEYGLDSCLSTRIRHGALKNHIRSVFEKLNLVTSKINEKYKDNEVWKAELLGYDDENQIVQTELKEFSKQIDDYNLYIVDNLIQIQTEKSSDKHEGLFRYFTNDELLFTFYETNKEMFVSIESTIDIILAEMVKYTQLKSLITIFNAFTKSIPDFFHVLIDSLIQKLSLLNLPLECQLIQNLNKSKTEIQNELEYISEWFSLNTTSSSSFLSMETIIDASLYLTNRINPLYNLTPNIDLKIPTLGYSNLIFIFNILLKNVIEHSKLPSSEIRLNLKIDLDESQNNVYIKVTNNLKAGYDYSANIIKLEGIKKNWNNHQDIERSNKEGESGFDKIKRILLYEAFAKTEKFDYSFSNNEISVTLFLPYNKPLIEDESINN